MNKNNNIQIGDWAICERAVFMSISFLNRVGFVIDLSGICSKQTYLARNRHVCVSKRNSILSAQQNVNDGAKIEWIMPGKVSIKHNLFIGCILFTPTFPPNEINNFANKFKKLIGWIINQLPLDQNDISNLGQFEFVADDLRYLRNHAH